MQRRIPNHLMLTDDRTKKLGNSRIPTPTQAIYMYRANGGHITEESNFGEDPLASDVDKYRIRESAFVQRYPSFEAIFHNLVNGNSSPFKNGLKYFIDITYRLSSSV